MGVAAPVTELSAKDRDVVCGGSVEKNLKSYLSHVFWSWICCSGCVMPSQLQLSAICPGLHCYSEEPWIAPRQPTAAETHLSMQQSFAEVADVQRIQGTVGLAFTRKNKIRQP